MHATFAFVRDHCSFVGLARHSSPILIWRTHANYYNKIAPFSALQPSVSAETLSSFKPSTTKFTAGRFILKLALYSCFWKRSPVIRIFHPTGFHAGKLRGRRPRWPPRFSADGWLEPPTAFDDRLLPSSGRSPLRRLVEETETGSTGRPANLPFVSCAFAQALCLLIGCYRVSFGTIIWVDKSRRARKLICRDGKNRTRC